MRRILLNTVSVLLAASTVAAATGFAASAQEDLAVSGNVSIVSDYRFRGVTQSNEEIAVQGGLDLALPSGFYVGAWGSSIGFANGTELDIYGGYGFEAATLAFDLGVLAYHYPAAPGSDDQTIWELYGSAGKTFGMLETTVGVAYIPEQEDTQVGAEEVDNLYVYGDGSLPLGDSAFSLAGHVGYTDKESFWNFAEDPTEDGFWDWSLGVTTSVIGMDVGLSYVGTSDLDESLGLGEENTVLLSFGKTL